MNEKCGNFDWIISYDEFKPYLQLVLCDRLQSKLLVIGCGTSTLSEQLADEPFEVIVSIDNDPGCIEHMARSTQEKYERLGCSNLLKLKWLVCDMVCGSGFEQDDLLVKPMQFDVILDKGTLDAVLVEGAIYEMLINVYNLLSIQGVYIICSISPPAMLVPLLSIPEFDYDITCHENCDNMRNIENPPCTIIMCKKRTHNILIEKHDPAVVESIRAYEKTTMDQYFQVDNSFVTKEFKERIYASFHHQAGGLSIQQAYQVLFGDLPELGYDYDLYMEDMQTYMKNKYSNEVSEKISYEDAIDFVTQMQ